MVGEVPVNDLTDFDEKNQSESQDHITIFGLDKVAHAIQEKLCTGKPLLIAIDGHPGAGKGTLSRFFIDHVIPVLDQDPDQLLSTPIETRNPNALYGEPSPEEQLRKGIFGMDTLLFPRGSIQRESEHFDWYRFKEGKQLFKAMDLTKDSVQFSYDMYQEGVTISTDTQVPFDKRVLIIEGIYSTLFLHQLDREDIERLVIIAGASPLVNEQRFMERAVTDRGYTEEAAHRQFEEKVAQGWVKYWDYMNRLLNTMQPTTLEALSFPGHIEIRTKFYD